jgi:flavin-dependent dehydrogenase
MPVRATKRGAERTPIGGDFDVLICGASFAGLAVARELRATRARVLVLDRYDIGERQTSACAAPTEWLRNLGLEASIRQTFGSLLVHTPHAEARWPLGWTFSTFDYRELCSLLWQQRGDATEFETAKIEGRAGTSTAGIEGVRTDRGVVRAGLVVDALGWRRVLGTGTNVQPPEARLSRGLEVHPSGTGEDLELWIDRSVIRAGYGWSFPAAEELRVGVGSFDPHDHVKQPTVALAGELGLPPEGYQGNWIPHKLRAAVEDGVFFAGDSAGHCLPLTAEGIRTAFYFGIACGRELRAVLEGRRSRAEALERYGRFSESHRRKFELMLQTQHAVPRLPPRALGAVTRAFRRGTVSHWAFGHYLRIAPPQFALPAPPELQSRARTPPPNEARSATKARPTTNHSSPRTSRPAPTS